MTHPPRPSRSRARRRGAFTLVEILVVIAIILVAATVTLLSFPRAIQSVNYSAAVNRTTAALGQAQTLASATGRRAAVAFLFDTQEERYTLQPLTLLNNRARLSNRPSGNSRGAPALAYQPALGTLPVNLPRGTAVFGLSLNHVTPSRGADNIDTRPTHAWYAGERFNFNTVRTNPWIFPRNDPTLFRDPTLPEDPWDPATFDLSAVRHANSFMIQFAPDGSIATTFQHGDADTPQDAYIEFPDVPIDPAATTSTSASGAQDPEPFDDEAVFDPEIVEELSGVRTENPEVVLRSVDQLAVVDLLDLARDTGYTAPWLLHPASSKAPWADGASRNIPGVGASVAPKAIELDAVVHEVSLWIDQNAEIIGFNRYTGQILKRKRD